MTRLALIADLHFGSVPEHLPEAFAQELSAMQPDAVVLAGDLTTSANLQEFNAARDWLEQLQQPVLVVPGNHDLPMHNLLQRFTRPRRLFKAAIGSRAAVLTFPDCAVFGLDTTATWQPHMRWQEGRVRRRDAAWLGRALAAVPDVVKVVVAHHPFATVPDLARAMPVRRSHRVLDVMVQQGASLVLSGHVHHSFVVPISHGNRTVIAVGAPTALSHRRRGEENGYWLIDVDGQEFTLTLRLRRGDTFVSTQRVRYSRGDLVTPHHRSQSDSSRCSREG